MTEGEERILDRLVTIVALLLILVTNVAVGMATIIGKLSDILEVLEKMP